MLVVGWDGADWRTIDPLIERGEMPNLKRFLDEGVRGNIATLQPMLSPMLWTSIATGKHADRHGVLGFAEPDPKTGKARPVTSSSRRCKAIWNILTDAGRPSGVINWYATHPAERIEGFVVTDRFAIATGALTQGEPHDGWPPVPGSVHPTEDLDLLAAVRIHPMMISPDQVRELVPSATDEECFTDPKLRELRVLLAHCATVHNAATAYLDERPWDFLGIYYDAIDRIAHAFMEFNPPRMAHISEADFARYKGVMEGVYRLHDMMLGRVMKLIDDETAVIICSDHGFYSDNRRPEGSSTIKAGKPVAWHRTFGMVALWGPGIKRGDQIHGATLLDITPTVLRLLDMPVARDMDGRPLVQAFETVGETMPTCETYENDTSHLPSGEALDDETTSHEMMRQLRDLGYIGDDDATGVEIDQLRNLGTVYLSTGRPRLALEQFRRVLDAKPEENGAIMTVATALLQMGRLEACEEMLDRVADDPEAAPRASLTRALVRERRGDLEGATIILEELVQSGLPSPGLLGQMGRMYLRRDLLDKAESLFVRALEYEPEDPEALDGLGVVYRRTGRAPEAVLAHVRSIALMRHRPQTHLNLARALLDADRVPWALDACRVAARMSPRDPTPHELLAEVYATRVGNAEKAAFHRKRAEALRAARQRRHEGPRKAGTPEPRGEAVTIVTGLPRSGTSLLMQMLEAGGIPALTDSLREADDDNPRGYYELEAVKRTATDDSWLDEAGGCCVKIVTALLRALPGDRQYRVVFLRRDIDEILASQAKMLNRLGRSGAALDTAELRRAFEEDLRATQEWLTHQPNIRVLEVWYGNTVKDAAGEAARLAEFVGEDLDQHAMAGAVDDGLYRQRRAKS
ncbi:hypothetical protein MNBD_PLANCTO03-1686 [hydrothermal vent metagenome]|uniref:Uncharacterized protein n=1 Tax=hydrothermal vent metagenome TaxID=652676 RepID=A0A3B1DJF0_9ZZZZ